MNENYLLSVPMWLVRSCIHIYFASCIMYTCIWLKGYIHSTHAYDSKTVLNVLVFKLVRGNGIIDSSKAF